MDTAFAASLFIAVFGPVAWMVRAELHRLSEVQTRVRISTVRPASAERAQFRGAAVAK